MVIVDTNILFSALLRHDSPFAVHLLRADERFVVNALVVTELFKHKERIVSLSQLPPDAIVQLFHGLIRRVELFREDLVAQEHRRQAYELCRDIDPTDAPHVAITLELKGRLWTGDDRLKRGLLQKGFDLFYEP